MRARSAWLLASTLVLGCTASDPCADVVAQLAAAREGESIVLDGCRIESPLAVPAGVTLEGRNGATVAVDDAVAIELLTGNGGATTLTGMLVESGGRAGIAVRGVGSARLEDVVVRARGGVAVGSAGASLVILGGELVGEVTLADRDDPRWLRVIGAAPAAGVCPTEPCECVPGAIEEARACDAGGRWATVSATHGLYVRGGSVTLEGTRIVGFALAAAVLEDTTAVLRDVRVGAGIGVGIESIGGTLDAIDTEITEVWSGLRGTPSYAALFASGAGVSTQALTVRDVEGYGVVHTGSAGVHHDLVIERAGDVALWTGSNELLEIVGGRIEDGAFAGVLAVDVASVRMTDVEVIGTRSARRAVGLLGAIDVGDGVQLIGSAPRLERVSIAGSERAGLVVELVSGTGPEAFVDVSVESAGAGLGAIAGTVDRAGGTVSASAAAGWDVGITRAGAAVANDPAFTGALDAVLDVEPPSAAPIYGAIGPMY